MTDNRKSQFIVSSITEPISESWSHTKLNLTSFVYKWSIDDFNFLCKLNVNASDYPYIESIKFAPPTDSALKFYLRLFFRGEDANGTDHIGLSLYLTENYRPKVHIKASILDEDGEKENSKSVQQDMTKGAHIGWPQFMLREDLLKQSEKLLKNDKLVIYCEIEIFNAPITTHGVTPMDENWQAQIVNDLNNVLQSKVLSDVILVVNEKEFHAHKAILGARSPVFARMFDNDMKEKKENRVDITDVQLEVFEELLRFIYTGKANSVDRFASELLILSDRYQLDSLKTICEMVLCAKVTPDCIGDLALMADTYNATQLKAKAIDYMGSHASNVVQKDNLKTVLQNKPELFYQLITNTFKNLKL